VQKSEHFDLEKGFIVSNFAIEKLILNFAGSLRGLQNDNFWNRLFESFQDLITEVNYLVWKKSYEAYGKIAVLMLFRYENTCLPSKLPF